MCATHSVGALVWKRSVLYGGGGGGGVAATTRHIYIIHTLTEISQTALPAFVLSANAKSGCRYLSAHLNK